MREHITPEIREHLNLAFKEQVLRNLFLEKATVANLEKGYIDAPWVNQLVIPKYQRFAAEMIAHHFKHQKIDKIVGIPTVGVPLSAIVSDQMDLPLALGRKGLKYPGSWKDLIIVKEEVPSFTTGKRSEYVFNSLMRSEDIRRGDRILFVDDVIAHGYTSEVMIRNFRKHGIETHVAVYFAKLFQPGVEKLRHELKVDPFYAIGIEEISEENIVRLSPPRF